MRPIACLLLVLVFGCSQPEPPVVEMSRHSLGTIEKVDIITYKGEFGYDAQGVAVTSSLGYTIIGTLISVPLNIEAFEVQTSDGALWFTWTNAPYKYKHL